MLSALLLLDQNQYRNSHTTSSFDIPYSVFDIPNSLKGDGIGLAPSGPGGGTPAADGSTIHRLVFHVRQ